MLSAKRLPGLPATNIIAGPDRMWGRL